MLYSYITVPEVLLLTEVFSSSSKLQEREIICLQAKLQFVLSRRTGAKHNYIRAAGQSQQSQSKIK